MRAEQILLTERAPSDPVQSPLRPWCPFLCEGIPMNDNLASLETAAPPYTEISSTTAVSGTDGFAGLSITRPFNAANDALVQIEQTEDPASRSKFEDFDRIRTNVPIDLHGLPIWLLYREQIQPGDPKPRKVPLYANGRYRGTTDTPEDREQLVTFEECLASTILSGQDNCRRPPFSARRAVTGTHGRRCHVRSSPHHRVV